MDPIIIGTLVIHLLTGWLRRLSQVMVDLARLQWGATTRLNNGRLMATDAYITFRPMCAVAVHDGRVRLGPICHIPQNVHIWVRGKSSEPGMIEVEWNSARYVVFAVDLKERTRPAPDFGNLGVVSGP